MRKLILLAGVAFVFTLPVRAQTAAPTQPPALTLDQQLDPIVADITAKVYQLRDIIHQGSDQNAQLKNGWMAANKQVVDLTKERDDLTKRLGDMEKQNAATPPATPSTASTTDQRK